MAVRLAAGLSVLAFSLNKISNCSWYNPASFGDVEVATKVLQASFKDDPRKMNLARSLFLSTTQREKVQAAIRSAAASESQIVFEKLRFLIIGAEQTFQSELDKLFEDWANFWLKMQYNKEEVVATLEEEDLDSEDAWLLMTQFGDGSQMQGMVSQSVSLFPCIYTTTTENIIQAGYYLCLEQELVVEAKREAEGMARRRSNGRKDQVRRRSASIFTSSTLGSLGRVAAQTASLEGGSTVSHSPSKGRL
jgi:hypothetical protein